MSERDRFTTEEWRTLQVAPFWVFSAVIGAYRRFGLFWRALGGTGASHLGDSGASWRGGQPGGPGGGSAARCWPRWWPTVTG